MPVADRVVCLPNAVWLITADLWPRLKQFWRLWMTESGQPLSNAVCHHA